MFLMPLSGWVLASASPIQDLLQMQNLVFGRFALPDPWVPGDRRGRERPPTPCTSPPPSASPRVLALHAGAALKHQFVDHDGVLARMVRGAWKRPRPEGARPSRPVTGQAGSGA